MQTGVRAQGHRSRRCGTPARRSARWGIRGGDTALRIRGRKTCSLFERTTGWARSMCARACAPKIISQSTSITRACFRPGLLFPPGLIPARVNAPPLGTDDIHSHKYFDIQRIIFPASTSSPHLQPELWGLPELRWSTSASSRTGRRRSRSTTGAFTSQRPLQRSQRS